MSGQQLLLRIVVRDASVRGCGEREARERGPREQKMTFKFYFVRGLVVFPIISSLRKQKTEQNKEQKNNHVNLCECMHTA